VVIVLGHAESQRTPSCRLEPSAQLREAQRQLYAARPQWLFAVYGVAIFSGLTGAIGLLLRKSWASMLFGLSLAAIIVQFGYIGLDRAVTIPGSPDASRTTLSIAQLNSVRV